MNDTYRAVKCDLSSVNQVSARGSNNFRQRPLGVGWDLADAFGLVVPRTTVFLVFRYFLAERSNI